MPIWSSPESEAVPFDASYSRAHHILLEDGSAFMVAAESTRSGLAGTLRLAADGSAAPGQFGYSSGAFGRLSPELVLATQGDRVLLTMSEREFERSLVAMVNLAGQVLWVRPRYGSQARFLANGDVLLVAGSELMRLRGNDGDLVWLRNLLDLRPNPVAVSVQLPARIETAIRLSLSYRELSGAGGEGFPDPLLVSLDAATGSLQWQLHRDSSPSRVFEACPPVSLGADSVHAFFELAGGQADVVFERRSGASGARLWATRVSAVDYSDGPCGFVATSAVLALSSRDEFGQSTLVALNHAGTVQWRTQLPTAQPAKLRPAEDGAVLVASQQLLGGSNVTVVERRSSSDGSIDWMQAIPASSVDLRVVNGELRIAWSTSGNASELHLQRRASATGALVEAHVALAKGLVLRQEDVEFIDGIPFAAMIGLDTDLRGVNIRRLDPESGAVVWSQGLQLAETPLRLLSASLIAGSPEHLVLIATYDSVAMQTAELREALLYIRRSDGELVWQRAHRLGTDWRTVGSDGSVYLRASECLSPPECLQAVPLQRHYAAGDGHLLWSRQLDVYPLAANDSALIVWRSGPFSQLQALDADSGADLWQQSLPANSTLPAAIALANGDVFSIRQFSVSGLLKSEIDRREAGTGLPLWITRPGPANDVVRTPVFAALPGGDLLFTARTYSFDPNLSNASRPLWARIDAGSGQIEWIHSPLPTRDRWMSVRPIAGATPSKKWARSLRYLDDSDGRYDERYALTQIDLADGSLSPEHLYVQELDLPLSSPGRSLVSVTGVAGDGTVQVENRSVNAAGLSPPRLQRWPAVGADSGDIVLRHLGDADPITALGPSTLVEFELANTSTSAVPGVVVGFSSPDDGLKAQIRSCQVIAGAGLCPTVLGGSLDQVLDLGPNAVMHLVYEVHDPGFTPRQVRSIFAARGVFRADPPYAFGDTDLGNNMEVIIVATGGMSNGFE
ncbi:MAG: PQQ-binding-like beta-propeller repeat protein [Xanthomonadales bacterium]|nr:PQQ-binding-like beta-propeller repeat protein [Xanthomonadales bacterium]MCP5476457.1 PQQ-binding-like beta-propeller repeat protein [Rhodanobacteraceae bacterium]